MTVLTRSSVGRARCVYSQFLVQNTLQHRPLYTSQKYRQERQLLRMIGALGLIVKFMTMSSYSILTMR